MRSSEHEIETLNGNSEPVSNYFKCNSRNTVKKVVNMERLVEIEAAKSVCAKENIQMNVWIKATNERLLFIRSRTSAIMGQTDRRPVTSIRQVVTGILNMEQHDVLLKGFERIARTNQFDTLYTPLVDPSSDIPLIAVSTVLKSSLVEALHKSLCGYSELLQFVNNLLKDEISHGNALMNLMKG